VVSVLGVVAQVDARSRSLLSPSPFDRITATSGGCQRFDATAELLALPPHLAATFTSSLIQGWMQH